MTVLVTGAARRIGNAIARSLAKEGLRVIVHSRAANDTDAAALASEIGGLVVEGDLSCDGPAEALFAKCVALAPDLIGIVNNASVFSLEREMSEDARRELFRVNCDVPMRLAELLADYVVDEGFVVNLLDCRILSRDALTPYEESKKALWEATIRGAVTLAPKVRVNAVAPGPILVPSSPANAEKGGRILLRRRPSVESVAKTVAFLASSSGITGNVISVDSGQSLFQDQRI